MYERITNNEVLRQAFQSVKRNKGCPGIDGISLGSYERNLSTHLSELSRLLSTRRYQPLPVKRVFIPKPNGKQRPIGIPAIRDRVVQQALLETIQPIFEPTFSDASFGFRPGRSAVQAINQIQEYLDEGYEYIVDADIRAFFGTLNHQRLMAILRDRISDRDITRLVWQFLRAGVMEEGNTRKVTTGTPQGGVISPLLANIYLDEFDHIIEGTGMKLVRYADDFVILCKTVNQATYALRMVRGILRRLHLTLAQEKTRIAEYRTGFDFLGYRFQKYYGKNMRWPSQKAVRAFKDKVRIVTRRQQPRNVRAVIERLNPLTRGWGNYFKHGNAKTRFTALDGWIRMRLRSFIEKKKWPSGMNWKYPNDHFARLGLVTLTELLAYQPTLSSSIFEQPARRAVCGKSARTVR